MDGNTAAHEDTPDISTPPNDQGYVVIAAELGTFCFALTPAGTDQADKLMEYLMEWVKSNIGLLKGKRIWHHPSAFPLPLPLLHHLIQQKLRPIIPSTVQAPTAVIVHRPDANIEFSWVPTPSRKNSGFWRFNTHGIVAYRSSLGAYDEWLLATSADVVLTGTDKCGYCDTIDSLDESIKFPILMAKFESCLPPRLRRPVLSESSILIVDEWALLTAEEQMEAEQDGDLGLYQAAVHNSVNTPDYNTSSTGCHPIYEHGMCTDCIKQWHAAFVRFYPEVAFPKPITQLSKTQLRPGCPIERPSGTLLTLRRLKARQQLVKEGISRRQFGPDPLISKLVSKKVIKGL